MTRKGNSSGPFVRQLSLLAIVLAIAVIVASCGTSSEGSESPDDTNSSGGSDPSGDSDLSSNGDLIAIAESIVPSDVEFEEEWEIDTSQTAGGLTAFESDECYDIATERQGLDRPRGPDAGGNYKGFFGTPYLAVIARVGNAGLPNYFAQVPELVVGCEGDMVGDPSLVEDFPQFGDETLVWEFDFRRSQTKGLVVWVRQDDIWLSVRYVGDTLDRPFVEELMRGMVSRIPADYQPSTEASSNSSATGTSDDETAKADDQTEASSIDIPVPGRPVEPRGAVSLQGSAVDGCCLGITADGRLLAHESRSIIVAGLDGSAPTAMFDHDGLIIDDAEALADGRIVSVGNQGMIYVWDPDQPVSAQLFDGHGNRRTYEVAELADGRVATTTGGTVLVWDPRDLNTAPIEIEVCCIQLRFEAERYLEALADGGFAFAAGRDVGIFDPAQPSADPVVIPAEVGDAGFAPLADGRIATGTDDQQGVEIWDPTDIEAGPQELLRTSGDVSLIASLPGDRVAAVVEENRVWIWDLADPTRTPVIWADSKNRAVGLSALVGLPDGRVVSGGALGLTLWDPEQAWINYEGVGIGTSAVAVLEDGRVIGASNSLASWNGLEPAAAPKDIGEPLTEGRAPGLTSLLRLSDSSVLVGTSEGAILGVDLESGVATTLYTGHRAAVVVMALLPDGRVVSAGERETDAHVWNPADPGAGAFTLQNPSQVSQIVALADGRVVTASRSRTLVWDLELATLEPEELSREGSVAAELNDGRVLILDEEGTAILIDGNDSNARGELRIGTFGGFRSALGLDDGRALFAAGDGTFIWDIAAGEVVQLMGIPMDSHGQLPNGLVVSTGPNGLLVWDPAKVGG